MAKKPKTIDDVMSDAMTVSRKAGSELVQAGLAQLKNDYNARLVAFVAGTMNQVRNLTTQIEQFEYHLQYQKDRLAAINDGAFTVSAQGNITFKEPRLNDGL